MGTGTLNSKETRELFDSIIEQSGIDLELVPDWSEIQATALECYFEEATKYADGSGPVGEEDERKLLTATAALLVKRLHTMFHEK